MIRLSASYAGEPATVCELPDLAAAAEKIRTLSATASPSRRLAAALSLGAASYTLASPVVFSSVESAGLAFCDLTVEGEGATISSNRTLPNADFVKKGNVYTYQMEKDAAGRYPRFRDFYVDGHRVPICRSASFLNRFPFLTEGGRASHPENYAGIYLPVALAEALGQGNLYPAELQMYVEWEFHYIQLTEIDFDSVREDEDGNRYVLARTVEDQQAGFVKGVNNCLNIKNRETFVANAPVFLTPGTYCYDHTTGLLSYMPEGALCGKLEIPTLEYLWKIEGMENLSFRGLTFTGATSKYACDNGYLSGQANYERRYGGKLDHAALLTRSVRRMTVEDCLFHELGGNGLIMLDDSTMIRIRHCRFTHIGMTALSIGNPTTAWEEPKNRNIDLSVTGNYFHDIGYSYPSAVACYIGMVDTLCFSHNTIDRCAYSALSAGWGWVKVHYVVGEKVNIRDAEISYNKITDYMQVLKDGAAIYVVGANTHCGDARVINRMHDNFACRELKSIAQRGYYMDGSASNWEVYDNVTSGTPLPIFSQYHVSDQFTWHNHITRIYSTEKVPTENHVPERDTTLGETFVEPTLEALFEKYPAARAIMEAAGCEL